MIGILHIDTVFRRAAAVVVALAGLAFPHLCCAETGAFGHVDAFYKQLLKLPDSRGYLPTRSFTIVVDTEHGNRLVASDDPNLRFNLLWMEQYQPGYHATQGGSAFGELLRSYLKLAYKAYRDHYSALSALPDENGSLHAADAHATNLIDAMDYNLKVTGDEVRFKIQYRY